MINLSTDSINARTPYKVERIDENSFVFTTNGGVVYSVGFVRDTSFMDYGLYQFFISKIDNVCYYTSIILRKDHPIHNQVISSFHDFVQDIPNKLNNM